MSAESGPALSVIVLVPDRFNTVLRVVTGWHARRSATRSSSSSLAVPGVSVPQSVVTGFWGWQLVEKADWRSSADARAIGVARARAPIVAFVEDHCFPTPGSGRGAASRARAGVGGRRARRPQREPETHAQLGEPPHRIRALARIRVNAAPSRTSRATNSSYSALLHGSATID